MNGKISLLGRKTYKVSGKVTVNIPSVGLTRGENIEDENNFWSEVGLFTISPDDMVVELSSAGIDFTEISEYSAFILLYLAQRDEKLKNNVRDLLFVGFNLWELDVKQTENSLVLIDKNNEIIIDENVYSQISELVCYITGREKTKRKKFGNEFAKEKWIEFMKNKKERALKKKSDNIGGALDGIILRLVCNANFPYNFETINNVTLFDLIYSMKQIDKDVNINDLMQSRLVGVDLSKYPKEQLSRYIL